MSTIKGSAKVWWVVIVLIVIIGGAWWWTVSQSPASNVPAGQAAAPAGNNPAAASAQGLTTSPSDNSDAALDQDLNSVDAQMNGLQSDTAAVDAGMASTSSSQ